MLRHSYDYAGNVTGIQVVSGSLGVRAEAMKHCPSSYFSVRDLFLKFSDPTNLTNSRDGPNLISERRTNGEN